MRPARVAVLATVPALLLLGLRHGAPAPELAAALSGAGGGTVAPSRVVTDGHPQPLAVRRPVPHPSAPPVTARAARPSRSVTAAPAPRLVVRAAVPRQAAAPVGDGYPFAHDTTGSPDPWGFTRRQCVSYVAWRLAQVGRPLDNARQGWGSALDWDEAAQRLGYRAGSRPAVGAVAQWNAGERSPWWSPTGGTGTFTAGHLGHVGWVTKVYPDGSVLVAQYNGSGDRSYSTMRVTAPRYLSL